MGTRHNHPFRTWMNTCYIITQQICGLQGLSGESTYWGRYDLHFDRACAVLTVSVPTLTTPVTNQLLPTLTSPATKQLLPALMLPVIDQLLRSVAIILAVFVCSFIAVILFIRTTNRWGAGWLLVSWWGPTQVYRRNSCVPFKPLTTCPSLCRNDAPSWMQHPLVPPQEAGELLSHGAEVAGRNSTEEQWKQK